MTTRTNKAITILAALCVTAAPMLAQQSSEVKNLLLRFKNWRYGMVSLYKVPDADDIESVRKLNIVLGPQEPQMREDAKECKYQNDLDGYVADNSSLDEDELKKILRAPGCKAYESYANQKKVWQDAQFRKAWVVTTRANKGETVEVIALLVQTSSESNRKLSTYLNPPSDIFVASQLQGKNLESQYLMDGKAIKGQDLFGGTSSTNLLDYLKNQIIQSYYPNVTAEAQGIGEDGFQLVARKYGNTVGINEDHVQDYIRISEGLPQDYQNNNEVIVSAGDGVSYRRYERSVMNNGGQMEFDSTQVTNSNLPKYGVELKYGLEDINYPSLWSERLALNALWGSSRLGLVLPTNGWSNLATTFGNTRTMTHSGVGVNGSFDFPIRVIDESGVFNVAVSYVFDDAVKTDHMVFNEEVNRYEDYLVRYHANLQYSFAIAIDKDFMFRMRLGGTIYGMESWSEFNGGTDSTEFRKTKSTTVGGVSGRVEFMTTSWATPVGFSLSYFDETVLGTAWLQIPVIDNFALRLDARVFAPVFRDPRLWEQSTVVMPALRFIFNF
jgi:hypothetical protein